MAQRRPGHGEGGPPSKRIVVGYGFWIFLLSDIIMFSAFFASYAVLAEATAGGPGAKQLFDVRNVGIETGFLLLSSFTCGVASIGAAARKFWLFQIAMAVTFVLGACFLGLEIQGNSRGWPRRARVHSAAPSCRPSSPWWAVMACTSRPA